MSVLHHGTRFFAELRAFYSHTYINGVQVPPGHSCEHRVEPTPPLHRAAGSGSMVGISAIENEVLGAYGNQHGISRDSQQQHGGKRAEEEHQTPSIHNNLPDFPARVVAQETSTAF